MKLRLLSQTFSERQQHLIKATHKEDAMGRRGLKLSTDYPRGGGQEPEDVRRIKNEPAIYEIGMVHRAIAKWVNPWYQ